MKVIDLINKIANGEEVPLVLKYNNKIYEYTKEIEWYLREDLKSELFIDKNRLNDEIEILEEEKKIPEKIEEEEIEISMAIGEQVCANKINEIINYLQYLKSKGE